MRQQSLFEETIYRDMSGLNQDDIQSGNFKEVAANLKKFYSDLKKAILANNTIIWLV